MVVSRGQEEAGCTRRTSYTTMNFVNALNKPPLKLSLSYQDSAHSNHIELANPTMDEIGVTNPEYQPL